VYGAWVALKESERVSMKQYGFRIVSTNGMIEGVPAPGTEVADGGIEHHKQGENDWNDEKASSREKQPKQVWMFTYGLWLAVTETGRA
jgi:hypothetical protein